MPVTASGTAPAGNLPVNTRARGIDARPFAELLVLLNHSTEPLRWRLLSLLRWGRRDLVRPCPGVLKHAQPGRRLEPPPLGRHPRPVPRLQQQQHQERG